MKEEKVVGILGGMGPFATVEFFRQILLYTPAKKEWEHLRILIDNNVKIPSRTRALLYNEASPVPKMIESINLLASIGADFVAVPCNQAHYFYKEVTPFIEIPWLNMIDITAKAVSILAKSRPLILGGYVTVKKRVYDEYIPGAKYLSEPENGVVIDAIEEIKLTSGLSVESAKRLEDTVSKREREIDCVVLACTEFSIVFSNKSMGGLPTVDSDLEYAREVVRYARNEDLP